MLGNNCLAVVVLVLWVVLIMYPLQSLFMCLGVFRVPRILEKQGEFRSGHLMTVLGRCLFWSFKW